MKKLLCITLAFVMVVSGVIAQDSSQPWWVTNSFVDYTGSDWLGWNAYQKNAYLIGFCTGSTASFIFFIQASKQYKDLIPFLDMFGKQLYLATIETVADGYVIRNIVDLQMIMDILIMKYPDLQKLHLWQIIYYLLGKYAVGISK